MKEAANCSWKLKNLLQIYCKYTTVHVITMRVTREEPNSDQLDPPLSWTSSLLIAVLSVLSASLILLVRNLECSILDNRHQIPTDPHLIHTLLSDCQGLPLGLPPGIQPMSLHYWKQSIKPLIPLPSDIESSRWYVTQTKEPYRQSC